MIANAGLLDDPQLPASPWSETEVFELVCRHMATLVGRRGSDFDDLVQIAAERTIRGLPGFEGRCSLSTWVFRICYTSLLQRRRWLRRWSRWFVLAAPEELPQLEAPHTDPEQRERRENLARALERLGDKLRVVVLLHDLEGRDSQEIAEMLGLNVLTVRSRLRDGRRALRKRLAKDPYFGDVACTYAKEPLP
jgi:RNA polymerase sigma-70 factor (ECF subfamily)